MRAFVLTTGRSGSTTFATACRYIENYTSAHESRHSNWNDRFGYPDNHIEVDPRLAWWLGTLDAEFGDDPVYVWLRRDREAVARSTAKRTGKKNAMTHWPYVAYFNPQGIDGYTTALHMVDQIEDNIALFLKGKTKVVEVWIENPYDFVYFWEEIGAKGDFGAAIRELSNRHNRSENG